MKIKDIRKQCEQLGIENAIAGEIVINGENAIILRKNDVEAFFSGEAGEWGIEALTDEYIRFLQANFRD